LSHGTDGTIQVWSPSSQTSSRIFSEHGNVEDAEYIEDGRRIASVGDDGRVLVWPPFGTGTSLLFKHPHQLPFRTIENLDHGEGVAVGDSKGAVWEISLKGLWRQIRPADNSVITILRASSDGTLLAIGNNAGMITIYETAHYEIVREVTFETGIHQIQFDPHNRDLLIVSEGGHVRVVTLSARPRVQWDTLAIDAQNVAYAKDGETFAFVCRNGESWFYSFSAKRWVYARDHLADIPWGLFSYDGSHFASTDRNGVVVVRDMVRTFTGSEK
jgi:WD40 repeat protein